MVGSELLDASSLYPPNSPLPGGGNTTLAYVAEDAGSYALESAAAVGAYDVTVNGFRPGLGDRPVDPGADGVPRLRRGAVNTGIWGGPGVRTLSPFSSFIARWGLTGSRRRR